MRIALLSYSTPLFAAVEYGLFWLVVQMDLGQSGLDHVLEAILCMDRRLFG